MNSDCHFVDDVNLSHAWSKVFLQVMSRGCKEVSPLVVTIHIDSSGVPEEDLDIRRALDNSLVAYGEDDCQAVANTIFPASLWDPSKPSHELYDRYLHLLPRLQKYKENRNGLYFQRMIAYNDKKSVNHLEHNLDKKPVNQLEHIISTYRSGNRRRTALQLSIFDPHEDHTNQRQRGFPCLQNVSFAPFGHDELSVTGFYTLQYVFEKAYGNYLGLCRLGRFVAHELDLRFTRMTCIAAIAVRGERRMHELKCLESIVAAALGDSMTNLESN